MSENPITEPDAQAPESEEESDGELFRREVLEEQGNKLIGDVVLLWPPGWSTLILLYSGIVLTLVMILLFGKYQRKERVPGILVPNQGLVQIVAETDGRIVEIMVQEGSWIAKGQPLLKISHESFLENKGGKYAVQLQELEAEELRFESQRQELKNKQDIEQKELDARIKFLLESRHQSGENLKLKTRQAKKFQKTFDAAERLHNRKVIGHSEYDQQLSQYTNARQSQNEEQTRLAEVTSHLKEARLQKQRSRNDLDAALVNLESKISDIKHRLVELESQKEILLQAPADGYASGLRSFVGQSVQSGQALLTLVPKDLQLEGNLFVSSRAAPFVHEGQKVWLQFEALSPTKFGVFPAVVQSVSRTALDPKDVKDIALDAPRYLVKVILEKSMMELYQKELNYKAGLLLEADILLDQRSLAEWLLDPLLRARRANGLEEL